MNPDRLDAALDRVASTFRGMTARPDEANCDCHWGDAEDLAMLKTPDVELPLHRLGGAWKPGDWTDHAAVLRRVLPQLTRCLVLGLVEPWSGLEEVGRSLNRGSWREWPPAEFSAVEEFLYAWWDHTLTDPDPAVPASEVFALCVEATATFTPWLRVWEAHTHSVADRHLVEAVTRWEYHLLGDLFPWETYNGDMSWYRVETWGEGRVELTEWLLRHASDRLRAAGASEELLHRVRLLGLPEPARYEDPHWPDRIY
ncbi:hypothetical protein [Herbidospora sp. RD11066]